MRARRPGFAATSALLLIAACASDRGHDHPPPAPTAERPVPRPAAPTATPGPPDAGAAPPARGLQPPALPPSSPGAPDLAALRALLARHRALRFDADARDRGCPDDQTLGGYLDLLSRYGEHGDSPGDVHALAGNCLDEVPPADRLGIDPPADPAYWACRIDAFTSDPEGESPWHYELRLRVRKSDRRVDLATLACPGTP